MAHSHNHDSSYAHSHTHSHTSSSSRNTLLTALCITLCYAIIEAAAGWWANSLALMSDAGHMVTDSSALAIGAFSAWLATRSPSQRYSFGFKRAEVLGALFNVLFMYGVVVAILFSALDRICDHQVVDFRSVIVIGSIGLLVNILVATLLSRGEKTLNNRAAMLHVAGDLLGSVAAIIAGVIIWKTGWTPIDPILSIFICVLILWSSTRLLLETLNIVMEAVPNDLSAETVAAVLAQAHPDIKGLHHLHLWTISSGFRALSVHVELDHAANANEVLERLEQVAKKEFELSHGTYQLEFDIRCAEDNRNG
jgi:cobalt-zinc-cadmium efflux system protein